MPRQLTSTVLLFGAVALRCATAALATDADFAKTVQPFFREHCTRCHGEKKQKGDLRMDTLSRDFAAPPVAMHWADIMERISAAEMRSEERRVGKECA